MLNVRELHDPIIRIRALYKTKVDQTNVYFVIAEAHSDRVAEHTQAEAVVFSA